MKNFLASGLIALGLWFTVSAVLTPAIAQSGNGKCYHSNDTVADISSCTTYTIHNIPVDSQGCQGTCYQWTYNKGHCDLQFWKQCNLSSITFTINVSIGNCINYLPAGCGAGAYCDIPSGTVPAPAQVIGSNCF